MWHNNPLLYTWFVDTSLYKYGASGENGLVTIGINTDILTWLTNWANRSQWPIFAGLYKGLKSISEHTSICTDTQCSGKTTRFILITIQRLLFMLQVSNKWGDCCITVTPCSVRVTHICIAGSCNGYAACFRCKVRNTTISIINYRVLHRFWTFITMRNQIYHEHIIKNIFEKEKFIIVHDQFSPDVF